MFVFFMYSPIIPKPAIFIIILRFVNNIFLSLSAYTGTEYTGVIIITANNNIAALFKLFINLTPVILHIFENACNTSIFIFGTSLT